MLFSVMRVALMGALWFYKLTLVSNYQQHRGERHCNRKLS